jgi:hypothetical protein
MSSHPKYMNNHSNCFAADGLLQIIHLRRGIKVKEYDKIISDSFDG